MRSKKILLIGALMAIVAFTISGCGENTPATQTNGNVKENQTTVSAEKNNQENISDEFLSSLKPTHTKAKDYPFEPFDGWLPGQPIDDLSTITDGRYCYRPDQFADLIYCTWEELKNIKVGDMNSSQFSICGSDGRIVSIDFLEKAEDMTVGEAVEKGYQRYYVDDVDKGKYFFGSKYNDIDYVNEIISVWGMPTEVYYKQEGEDILLLYETETCNITLWVLNFPGLKKPKVSTLYVSGFNSIPFDSFPDYYTKLD